MRTTLLALSALQFVLGVAHAQISPGPLSRAHQSLEGATQCTTCHKFGGEAILKCLDCHTEIAERLTARKGLHATYGMKAGSSQECARCHSEHNGPDFQLVKFDPKNFDHKQAGYVLQGKHAGISCNLCHTPGNITGAQRAAIKVHDLSRTFLGLNPACTTCHEDAHNGRLGTDCAQCHNSTDWKNTAGQFDHSKARFPLTGLHAQVQCQQCHTPGPDNQAPLYRTALQQVFGLPRRSASGEFRTAELSVLPQHRWMEEDCNVGSEQQFRPLPDQVSAAGEAPACGLRLLPSQGRFQTASRLSEVYGLPPGRAPGTVRAARGR